MFLSHKKIFLQAFLATMAGAMAVALIMIFSILFPDIRKLGDVNLGALEELLKFGGILLLIYLIQLKPFAIPFIGLGFGFTEAVAHLDSVGIAKIRPFWTHIIFGLVMALFFCLAFKAERSAVRKLFYILALVIPALIHVSYNYLVISGVL